MLRRVLGSMLLSVIGVVSLAVLRVLQLVRLAVLVVLFDCVCWYSGDLGPAAMLFPPCLMSGCSGPGHVKVGE